MLPGALVGVLALQGDVTEHRAALAELGVESRLVRTPEDLAAVEGLIIPGGESTTMSMLLESSGLAGPVGERLSSGMPAFGTCAGMILLAREVTDGRPYQVCYGAIDLVVRRNGYGSQLQSFETDLDVALDAASPSALSDPRCHAPAPLHAVFIRAPVVEEVGPEVEVLATLPSSPLSASPSYPPSSAHSHRPSSSAPHSPSSLAPHSPSSLAPHSPSADVSSSPSAQPNPVVLRQGRVLVTSFHPELTRDRRLHELFASMVVGDRNGHVGPDAFAVAGPTAPSAPSPAARR